MEEKDLVKEITDSLDRIESDYSKNSQDVRKLLRIAGLSKLLFDLSKSIASIAIDMENNDGKEIAKELLDTTHFVAEDLVTMLDLDNKYLWPKE